MQKSKCKIIESAEGGQIRKGIVIFCSAKNHSEILHFDF